MEKKMEENDIITIKAVASILEYMACGKTDVNYTAEALAMLSNQLMEVVNRFDKTD